MLVFSSRWSLLPRVNAIFSIHGFTTGRNLQAQAGLLKTAYYGYGILAIPPCLLFIPCGCKAHNGLICERRGSPTLNTGGSKPNLETTEMAILRPDTSRSQLYRRPDPSEVSCSDKRMSASPHAGDRILAQVGLGSPRRKNRSFSASAGMDLPALCCR